MQRNSAFSLFNLSCREKASLIAFPQWEACRSKPLNALCPYADDLVGTLLPLPMGKPSAFAEHSAHQAIFLIAKKN